MQKILKNKNVIYGFLFLLIATAGCFFFYIYFQETYIRFDQDSIEVIRSKEYWTSDDVVVSVNYHDSKINVRSYSFDGGTTWQDSNEYVVEKNKIVDIMLKSSNGKLSKPVSFRVDNVDKDVPEIIIDDIVYVKVGTILDLKDIYEVIDKISGIRGGIDIKAEDLNTLEIGEYEIEIYAVDRALNSNTKKITIAVVDEDDPNLPQKSDGKDIAVTGLTLNTPRANLVKDTQVQVIPNFKPTNATNKKIVWTSNNTTVATVSKKGIITGVSAGTATITATTEDGGKSSEVRVTVTDSRIEVISISLDRASDLVTTETKRITLTATVFPENATDQEITWISNKPQVASVKDGVVTIRGEGDATITATMSNGRSATYRISVRDRYTFKYKEQIGTNGEIRSYSVKIFKNGFDITPQVVRITEPFVARNTTMGRTEIIITPEQFAQIRDSITVRTNENFTAYR